MFIAKQLLHYSFWIRTQNFIVNIKNANIIRYIHHWYFKPKISYPKAVKHTELIKGNNKKNPSSRKERMGSL